jgi:hypothetical protein
MPTDTARLYVTHCPILVLLSPSATCVVIFKAYQAWTIAHFVTLNVASADLNRVIFRSKKKLAPVRST